MLVVVGCVVVFSVDETICKRVRAGLTDRMPLTQLIQAFLSVCLFIHQGVFDLLLQRLRLPLHNFLLYCIAAEQGDNVIGLHVLPSYAHTRLFMGVCVGRNDWEVLKCFVWGGRGILSETVDLLCFSSFTILCLLVRTICYLTIVFLFFLWQRHGS